MKGSPTIFQTIEALRQLPTEYKKQRLRASKFGYLGTNIFFLAPPKLPVIAFDGRKWGEIEMPGDAEAQAYLERKEGK